MEGPPTPDEGWAHVHIDGLGNASVTVSLHGGVFWLACFTSCLRTRKSRPDHYEGCLRRFPKEMAEPGSVEWVVKHAVREILDDITCMHLSIPREIRIQKLWEYHRMYAPAAMLLGKPYYLI